MNIDTLANTTGRIASPTPAQLAAGRLQLDAAIKTDSASVAAARRGPRPRRWGLSALALAGAAAAAVLVAPLLLTTAPASAREVLLAAADAAGHEVDQAAGAAYWHVTSEVDELSTDPYRRDVWKGRSDVSVLRTEQFAAEAAKAAGGALDPTLVRTESLGPAMFSIGDEALSWAELEQLPTNADELKEFLTEKVRDHPAGEDNQLWEVVTGLLLESPASPALRRALWEVAASIPNVELLGPMTDSVGREGVAVEYNQLDRGWYRVVLILDPTNGTLFETRNIDADGVINFRMTQLSQEASATAPTPEASPCPPEATSGC